MRGNFIGHAIGAVFDTDFIDDGAGVSTGVATVTGVGASTHAGVGSATGVAADAVVGATTAAATAAATGAATTTGIADAVKETVAVSAGTSACDGIGEQEGTGVGSAAGVATVTGVGLRSFDKLTDTQNNIQEPVDFWLPASQTGVQGKPGQLNKALFRQVFNE